MTNTREIRYVFDLNREYEVSEHIINYLKMYGVFVDCGRHLYSPKKEGFDYYRAAFSYYGKDIKQVRDDQSCAWILNLPNRDQIMIFDNGDISFKMIVVDDGLNVPIYRNSCKISCDKSDNRICLTIEFGKNRKTKVDISKDRLGCIDIVLYDIWTILYQRRQPRRCQIFPGQPFTTDEYIEMLKENMCIVNKNELRWIYAMFDDPRLYQFLDKELRQLPSSLEDWYTLRVKKILEAGNDISDRESLMLDRCYLDDIMSHSGHLLNEQLPKLVKFDGRIWKQ